MCHHLRELGLHRRVGVRSAGTRVGQKGRAPDPRVVQVAARDGIRLRGIRARSARPRILKRSNYILAMDNGHLEDLERLSPGISARNGVGLLGEFSPDRKVATPAPEVPDPYYGGPEGFELVYAQIDACVRELAGYLCSVLEDGADSAAQ